MSFVTATEAIVDALGAPVTHRSLRTGDHEIVAVLQQGYEAPEMLGVEQSGTRTWLEAKSRDAAAMQVGDLIITSAVEYRITSIEPDPDGLSIVSLEQDVTLL